MTPQAKTTPKARSKERTKRVNPLGERQRLWKPAVDYNGPGASLCNRLHYRDGRIEAMGGAA